MLRTIGSIVLWLLLFDVVFSVEKSRVGQWRRGLVRGSLEKNCVTTCFPCMVLGISTYEQLSHIPHIPQRWLPDHEVHTCSYTLSHTLRDSRVTPLIHIGSPPTDHPRIETHQLSLVRGMFIMSTTRIANRPARSLSNTLRSEPAAHRPWPRPRPRPPPILHTPLIDGRPLSLSTHCQSKKVYKHLAASSTLRFSLAFSLAFLGSRFSLKTGYTFGLFPIKHRRVESAVDLIYIFTFRAF